MLDIRRGPRLSQLAASVAVCLLVLSIAGSAAARPGDLDSSFGQGGKVITPLGGATPQWSSATTSVTLPDGDAVVAGGANNAGGGSDFALVRYNSDGSLDTSFSGDGKVITTIGAANPSFYDYIGDVIALPGGDLVAVGGAARADGGEDFALVRYNADGSLDQTFGGGSGKVVTTVGDANFKSGAASSVAVLPDGDLVVVGGAVYAGNPSYRMTLARYDATTGTLVNTFGQGGVANALFSNSQSFAVAVAVLPGPGGDIVAVGQAGGNQFALARYDATTGTLVNGFGQNGHITTGIDSKASAEDVVVLPNGDLVVAGWAETSGGERKFTLVKYSSSDGSSDTSFSGDGIVTTPIGNGNYSVANSMKLLPGGDLTVAGRAKRADGKFDFALARYSSVTGELVDSFGQGGKVTTSVGSANPSNAFGESLDLLPNGDFIVAGSAVNSGGNSGFALARYDGDDADDPITPGDNGSGNGSGGGTAVTNTPAQCFLFSGAAGSAKSKRVVVAKKLKATLMLSKPKAVVKVGGGLSVKLSATGGKKGAKRLAKLVKQVTFTVNGRSIGKDKKGPFTANAKQALIKVGNNKLKAVIKLRKGSKTPTLTLSLPIKQVQCS